MKYVLFVLALASIITFQLYSQTDFYPNSPLVSVYFPMNGDTVNVADTLVSVKKHNITMVADKYQNKNGAFYFNGINAYLETSPGAKIDSSCLEFTISFFSKPDIYPASVFTKTNLPCNDAALAVTLHADSTILQIHSEKFRFVHSQKVRATVWHHYLLTWDGDSITYYLDGTFADKIKFTKTVNASDGPLFIGRDAAGSVYYKGALDEFRFYNIRVYKDEAARIFENKD